MPRDLGPSLSGSPHIPAHTFAETIPGTLASSPDEEAVKQIRSKTIRRKEDYKFLICKRTALNHSNQGVCKVLENVELIPLQMPAPPKAVLLAPT